MEALRRQAGGMGPKAWEMIRAAQKLMGWTLYVPGLGAVEGGSNAHSSSSSGRGVGVGLLRQQQGMVGVDGSQGAGEHPHQQQEKGQEEGHVKEQQQQDEGDEGGCVQYLPGVQAPAVYQMQAAVRRDIVKFGAGGPRPLLALKPLRTGRVHQP